jgi:hypothetical protein
MVLGDWIAIAVILLIVGGASAYIIKAKRSGKKCIGCPYADTCGTKGKSACSQGCSCQGKTK